jgi:hypothetical protein
MKQEYYLSSGSAGNERGCRVLDLLREKGRMGRVRLRLLPPHLSSKV